MKKFNKKIIAKYFKTLNGESFEVYVLDDGEWFNIHVIDETFNQDEMNTLKLQETKTKETLNSGYFNKAQLVCYLMEHFIWSEFYSDGIWSGSVSGEFQQHDELL